MILSYNHFRTLISPHLLSFSVTALRHREWNVIDGTDNLCRTADSMVFSLASYNILSQNLLEDNLSLYRHCEPRDLDWDFRKVNLLSEIEHYQPDVSRNIKYFLK